MFIILAKLFGMGLRYLEFKVRISGLMRNRDFFPMIDFSFMFDTIFIVFPYFKEKKSKSNVMNIHGGINMTQSTEKVE